MSGMADQSNREARDRMLFDRIAGKYVSKDLHPASRIARRYRLVATVDAATIGRDIDILEVGCGAGFSAEYLRGRFRSYTGIDYSDQLIALAREHHALDGVNFESANGKDFYNGRQYDAVLMVGVLHHVPDKDSLLSNLLRLMKPNGWLIVNEPQPNNPVLRFARSVRSKVDSTYSEEQEQLSPEFLRALFVRHGLRDIRLQAQGFLSTPFAEVELPPRVLTRRLAQATVGLDRLIERLPPGLVGNLSWNCIAAGRRPHSVGSADSVE